MELQRNSRCHSSVVRYALYTSQKAIANIVLLMKIQDKVRKNIHLRFHVQTPPGALEIHFFFEKGRLAFIVAGFSVESARNLPGTGLPTRIFYERCKKINIYRRGGQDFWLNVVNKIPWLVSVRLWRRLELSIGILM